MRGSQQHLLSFYELAIYGKCYPVTCHLLDSISFLFDLPSFDLTILSCELKIQNFNCSVRQNSSRPSWQQLAAPSVAQKARY